MTGEPVPAARDALQRVERIRETVVRAREQAELARLLRALEEGARVGGRHHIVAFPLHDENMTGAAGCLDPMAAAYLSHEGRPGRRHVVGLGGRELGEARRSV